METGIHMERNRKRQKRFKERNLRKEINAWHSNYWQTNLIIILHN